MDFGRLAQSASRMAGLEVPCGSINPACGRQVWDRFVRHDRELAQRLEYMHLNPVKNGLVGRPEDWNWSSFNNYSLDRTRVARCPIAMDKV